MKDVNSKEKCHFCYCNSLFQVHFHIKGATLTINSLMLKKIMWKFPLSSGNSNNGATFKGRDPEEGNTPFLLAPKEHPITCINGGQWPHLGQPPTLAPLCVAYPACMFSSIPRFLNWDETDQGTLICETWVPHWSHVSQDVLPIIQGPNNDKSENPNN